MNIILDPQNTRPDVSKPYQVKILGILRSNSEPLSPREIWLEVNIEFAEAVSRSKVISFLETGVDNDIIDFIEDADRGMRYYLNG